MLSQTIMNKKKIKSGNMKTLIKVTQTILVILGLSLGLFYWLLMGSFIF